MNKILFALSIVFSSFLAYSQGGINCSGMAPICTDVGLDFTANADGQEASFTDPGNDYDCLGTQPNPTWYYFQIATDGDIIMELAAASDIDFAIWGPFTSLSVAQAACGSLGNQVPPDPNNGNLVDCSFSIAAVENPVITTAITGEVYVMLITNYAGVVQDITLTQTGGTGSTDCDIVTNPPCSISALNTTISGCDFVTNSYEITGSVDITDPPASGDLVLEDCDGNTTVIASAPFNATSYAYTLSNLSANGSACTLQAYFTSEPTCSQTVNYVAPACISNCPSYALQSSSATETCGNQMYWLEIENSGCNGFLSFDVVGNYGSLWANEISWTVTSNTSGNIVAQGGPGSDGGAINVSVGPLDPSVEGDLYTLEVVDVFGDGFNGAGGFIEIQQNGTVLTNSITTFTTSSTVIVQPSVDVSSSTLTVNTPSGTITNVTSNCLDHEVGIMLANTNFCTPIVVDLPWSIICDVTGGLISSGIQTVTVYPQVPSTASDLVSITWNTTTCSWDISANNDCSELDIGSIFTITPDLSSVGSYCSNGSENFSVSYTGFSGGLNCCSTSGPELPIEYTENQTVTNAAVASSPFGGINNSAYFVIPANGIGGNATDLAFDFSMTGYCFDPVDTETDDSYWVTIYVDGLAIYDVQHFDPPGSMNQSFTLADMPNGYNENSIIEVYVYPNSFGLLDGSVMTTYVPNGSCPNPGDANWTCSSAIVSFSTTYEQTAPSEINCEFPIEAPYTCCTTSPLSAEGPAAVNVQCISDLPVSDIGSITNIVSDCPVVVAFVSDASDGNSCPEVITRTYSVTDDCGSSINVTQTITVNDITPPVFSTPPANITVECVDDIPAMIDLSWTDNCDGAGTATGVDGPVLGPPSCGGTFTRTWTYIDACGNVATETQDITVFDTTPPVFTSPPVNITVECAGDVPAMIDLSWTDNCDGAGTVTGVDGTILGGSCGGTITRTWTYMDACENVATATQVITIDDTTPPSASNPAGISVECVVDVPSADISVVTDAADNCTAIPTISFVSDNSDGNTCPEIITRTYSVTDDCGNEIMVTQTITVNDITPPTASNLAGVNVECVDDIPVADISVVTDAADNCTAIPTVSFVSDVSDGNTCPETITRAYSVTDDCGNSTNVTQTITVTDITPPIASNPPNIDIPIAPAPDPDITVITDATDNCTPSPIVAFVSDQSDGGDCPEVITRTYSVTDDCGNETLVTQLIIIGGGLVPTPTVSANGPICEGEDAEFTIDGLVDAVVTYDIGTGPTTITLVGGSAIVSVPSVSSDVTITLSNIADGSCSSIIDLSATTVVTPLSLPTFTSFGPYCQNESPDVLPALSIDGFTGIWNPPNIDASISGTETYIFTPDLGQCASETNIEVLVTPLLLPAFLQIDPLCLNETAPGLPVLSQGGISGSWTPAIINTSAVGISTYTFTPDVGQCADIVTMDIEVLTLPTVIFAEEQLITCITNTSGAQIGTAGVVGNTYSWSPATGLSNPSIGDPIASPAITTLYTLTVTDASGCSEDGMVTVTVDDTPPVVAITNNTGSTTLTCTQLEISVTATGADAYNWDNGLGNSDSPNITSPGIYTVTGTGANGCESSAQIEIFQDNGVDLLLALAQPEICSGEAVNLSINSSNATDFNWTVIQNGAIGASNGTASNDGFGASISEVLTVTGVGNGTVDYAVEPVLGTCVGEAQVVTVTVLAPETPQFNQLGPFCINDVSTTLPANSLEGIAGTWSPSAVSTTLAGTSTYSFTPNSGQCAANQTMDIVVNELPSVSFSGDSLVGCAPHTVVLTSENNSSTWTISNGVTLEGNEVTIVLTNPGCYDVTLQVDENGCTNSLTMPSYICIEQDPIAAFTASPDLFTDDDALVSFTNLSSGASSFIWDFGDGNTSTYINPSNLYENTEEGALITLTAISDFGCMDQAQLIIEYDEQEIFYIPNTFTPDGDNFNQIFTPVFYSGFDPYNFEMLIFNRWGEIVFETHNAEIGWDGSYGVKGIKAMDGTYSWKITYKNPKTDERKVIVGHVTLMR